MAQSSIHIIEVSVSSEKHNRREVKLEYVREDLSDLNESSEDKSIDQAKKEVASLYTEKTKQKLHASMKPIREGVINLNENHTMEDVQACCRNIEKEFGIEIFQVHIHRDEGHWSDKVNKTGEWKPNLHAQVLMKWQNQATGKSFRPSKQDLSKLQDIVAYSLNMTRGKTSSKKHETALQYKISKLEEEINEATRKYKHISEKLKHGLSFYNNSIGNPEKLFVKNFLGVIDKEGTKQQIIDALAAVGAINSRLEANLKLEKEKKEALEMEVEKIKKEVSPNLEKIKELSQQVFLQEKIISNKSIYLKIEEDNHAELKNAISRIGYKMVDYENDQIYSAVRDVEFRTGVSKGLVYEDDVPSHLEAINEFKKQQNQQKYKGPRL